MAFYTDIAIPARDRALKQIQAQSSRWSMSEEEEDAVSPALPLASTVAAPRAFEAPEATPEPSYTPAPTPMFQQSMPQYGLSPQLEEQGLMDYYTNILDVDASQQPPRPPSPGLLNIGEEAEQVAAVPTPYDPRGREKRMGVTSEEAAVSGREGQVVELTPEMARNASLIDKLAERGVKVKEVSTFSSEGAGRRALMGLGVAADVIGSPFEVFAETAWESIKFATGTGGVPILFKEGYGATVEQHRKRHIAAQIGLGIVFDPFILAKLFTIPAKASGTVIRANVKAQLVDLVENNATDLRANQIDDGVDDIVEQIDAGNLTGRERDRYYQNNNPLGNLDDPDLAFGADELQPVGAGREPVGAAYRVPPEEAAAPSPAAGVPWEEPFDAAQVLRETREDVLSRIAAQEEQLGRQLNVDEIEEIRVAMQEEAAAPSPAAVPTTGSGFVGKSVEDISGAGLFKGTGTVIKDGPVVKGELKVLVDIPGREPFWTDASALKETPAAAAVPTPVAAADDSQRQVIANKWATAKARNSANAATDLNKLKEAGFDVQDAEDALKEYKDTVRADFDDAESFSEARSEAWDDFVAALDEAESIDAGVPAAAVTPSPAAAAPSPAAATPDDSALIVRAPEPTPKQAKQIRIGTERRDTAQATVDDLFAKREELVQELTQVLRITSWSLRTKEWETTANKLRQELTKTDRLIRGAQKKVNDAQGVIDRNTPTPRTPTRGEAGPVTTGPDYTVTRTRAEAAPARAAAPIPVAAADEVAAPRFVESSKPRYRGATPEFESPLDKALYIVAKTGKLSAKDEDFMEFAMDATGLSRAEVRAAGKEIRTAMKGMYDEGADTFTVPRQYDAPRVGREVVEETPAPRPRAAAPEAAAAPTPTARPSDEFILASNADEVVKNSGRTVNQYLKSKVAQDNLVNSVYTPRIKELADKRISDLTPDEMTELTRELLPTAFGNETTVLGRAANNLVNAMSDEATRRGWNRSSVKEYPGFRYVDPAPAPTPVSRPAPAAAAPEPPVQAAPEPVAAPTPEDVAPPVPEPTPSPAGADVPPNGPPTPPPGRMAGDEPPLQFNDDGSVDVLPPVSRERNIINLLPIRVGLSSTDKVRNLAAQLLGKIIRVPQIEEIAEGVANERKRVWQNIESLANNLGAKTQARFSRQRDGTILFVFDDQGRIPALAGVDPGIPGAPTLQDVAARLPNYADSLTPKQMEALRELQNDLRPWRQMLDELGFDISYRSDVMLGPYQEPGFYIPRGRTFLEGADEPIQAASGRRKGGKAGFEKGATFDSMAQGIEDGHEYAQLWEIVQSYAHDAGSRALDKHVANFMISVREEGVLVGITPKMRLLKQNPGLVAQKELLDKNLNRLKGLLGRLTERQQKIIDDFIYNDEFDDIDALRTVLGDVRAAGGPNAGASIREVQTLLNDVRAEAKALAPEWKRARDKAKQAAHGERAIDLSELNNRTFPVALADAVNGVLKRERATPWNQVPLLKHIAALNNLYRGFNATGDNSALGIQGLLGFASDPQAYGSALKTNIRAWGRGGDQVLGQFLLAFDDKAAKSGRMNSVSWGQETLRLGGQDTEYLIGRGGTSFLNKVPVIRQANRAFGYFGDALRLQWADDELERLIRTTGKSIEELRDSGEVRRIAEAVNGATGYSPNKAFGDIGDLVFFAPRFLQARLETVARGLISLRPGATVEQRFARRSLLKLIGYGTLITYAANMMLGNETEVKPWKDGRYNSNFMRIRFGDRDISAFGAWELFPRAIISTAQGKPQDVIRGLGSGVVSSAWDLMWNKDFMGKAVYGEEGNFAEWLLGHVTPFAADELLPTTRNLVKGVKGDPRSLVAGITSAVLETVGGKSSPLTGSEATAMAREAQAQAMGNTLESYASNKLGELVDERSLFQRLKEDPKGTLRGGIQTGDVSPSPIYDQLAPWDKKKIDKMPAVADAIKVWEEQQRERQSEYRQYKDADDNLLAEFTKTINELEKSANAGNVTGKEVREAITLHQRELALSRQYLRESNSEALEWLNEKEPAKGIENEAMADYSTVIFTDELTDPLTYQYNFEERDRRIADLRAKYGDKVIDDIQSFIRDNDPPLIKQLNKDRELLKGYWEIEENVISQFSEGMQDRFKEYREHQRIGLQSWPGQWNDILPIVRLVEQQRRIHKIGNRPVDEVLAKWGYRTVAAHMDIRMEYSEPMPLTGTDTPGITEGPVFRVSEGMDTPGITEGPVFRISELAGAR